MAEFVAVAQTLTAGQDVTFQGESRCCNVRHHNNSPLFTLKGNRKCDCTAKYKVCVHIVFTAVAAAPVQYVLTEDGIVLPETLMAAVPAAVGETWSMSTVKEIPVDCECARVTLRAVTAAAPLTYATMDFQRIS